MSRRQTGGSETWSRLINWTREQTRAERLAGHLLRIEGYQSIDPSHPLGGPDRLKDIVCERDNIRWVGAVYFPREQKPFRQILKKFTDDLTGVEANHVNGFIFVTNQEIRVSERNKLKDLAGSISVDLFHLERIASILDSPVSYGIRLEFLEIEMSREEQLAFIADRDRLFQEIQLQFQKIADHLTKSPSTDKLALAEIQQFKNTLDSIAGSSSLSAFAAMSGFGGGHVRNLKVPLAEIQEFRNILDSIAGNNSMAALAATAGFGRGHVRNLKVPLDELREYEQTLDTIIEKLERLQSLKP